MAESSDPRRYSAILAMDVVGFSQLVERDEIGAIRAVRRLRTDILAPVFDEWNGRLVKTMGDGFLAEFANPDEALEAAMAIQNLAVAAARERPAAQRIHLRAGLHLGDVIVDGEDILGDGVNIAARLERLAKPCGIAASSTMAQAVSTRLQEQLEDDGKHTVKNIARAIHVWRWLAPDAPETRQLPDADPGPPTIAVLAFVNRSPDPNEDYFAQGLAEDITSALQHMARLPVVSSASSLALDANLPTQDAARILGARYLVRGSVRRSQARVRVSVELLEGATAHCLWSERYDRPLENVFEIQDDIALRVVSGTDTELVQGEINRLNRQRPEKLGAWDHYLRGMAEMRRPDSSHLPAARDAFRTALAIEPGYGEAWAGLAWACLKQYGFSGGARMPELLEEGYAAAKKGVALSERSPFARYALSTAYVWRGEKELSLKELEAAIDLNPFFTRARIAYHNRRELSDPTVGIEAAEEIRKALALSPREPDRGFYFWAIARINLVAGENEEALDWAGRALSVRPDDPNMHFRRAICLAALDRVSEAERALAECDGISPGFVAEQHRWRPYDDARDDIVFAGLRRHQLGGWRESQ